MSHTPISSIIKILDQYKIGQQGQRTQLAGIASKSKRPFTTDIVEMLILHYTGTGGDPQSCIALAITDGTWQDLADNLRRQKSDDASEAAEARAKADSSRMASVTEANPYGWDQPKAKMGQDHDIPGEWNPYRQSYNLTASERAEHRTQDHRRRGCSRWEVLNGKKGSNRESAVRYDAAEVARAMGKDYGDVPTQADRRVYGE